MSAPWWNRGSTQAQAAFAADGVRPQLQAAARQVVADALKQHIPAYTPEWTRRDVGDAGMALVRLFSEQMEPVLQRLNRLPEKALVEFLTIAGVAPLPASAARALLEFEVAATAPQSVQVPDHFQCSARSQGELVIFETERALYAAPGEIAQLQIQAEGSAREVASDAFLPFGDKSKAALLIGLSGDVAPAPRLSIALALAGDDGPPPAAAAGGLAQAPAAALPLLAWEVLDGGTPQPAAVVLDESRGLTQSGIVELELPARWRPFALTDGAEPLRWLRLRIVHGSYAAPPRLAAVRLNCVWATAARTVFDEVLQPVPGSEGREWSVAKTPVLPGSLQLEVDEGGFDAEPVRVPWSEAATLVDAAADAKVYSFDARRGVVRFGDGQHGEAAPRGFRHIRAARYQVGGGAAGAVPAKAITTMVDSVAYLTGVSNPLPASGGGAEEQQSRAIARGPQELRARSRAVTVADYELLAQRAPGALIARAHAVAGLHPGFPGQPQPGVVAVFVVPADGPGHPLSADAQTLAAVADYLAGSVAPAGVQVVAAAPRYHRIRVEAGLVVDARSSASQVVSAVLERLDAYFDPRVGGADARGWPFGGRLVYAELVQQVSRVPGVHAVHHLNLVVDGARVLACQDHDISAHGLLAPVTHDVVITGREAA
jgi:predicted phage baseplate assembly protein